MLERRQVQGDVADPLLERLDPGGDVGDLAAQRGLVLLLRCEAALEGADPVVRPLLLGDDVAAERGRRDRGGQDDPDEHAGDDGPASHLGGGIRRDPGLLLRAPVERLERLGRRPAQRPDEAR